MIFFIYLLKLFGLIFIMECLKTVACFYVKLEAFLLSASNKFDDYCKVFADLVGVLVWSVLIRNIACLHSRVPKQYWYHMFGESQINRPNRGYPL